MAPRCEICGRKIEGEVYRRVVEGAKLIVCRRCAKYGEASWEPEPHAKASRRAPSVRRAKSKDMLEEVERYRVVEGYGRIVKEARERMGLSPKELAERLGEKESVIKRIEREELVPDMVLVGKLRTVLRVELLAPSEEVKPPAQPKPRKPTLGELVKRE